MQSYVQLTLSEYDELKKIQVEATTLVEQTNKNLKQKLDVANSKISELEADLRKYAIGGARMRSETEVDDTWELDSREPDNFWDLLDSSKVTTPPISEVELIAEDEVPEEDCTEANEAIESFTLEEDKPSQTRGSAKLGRRRWKEYELGYMKQYAQGSYKLRDVAFSLGRTVSSIKTQASRMGLNSSNNTLSEVE